MIGRYLSTTIKPIISYNINDRTTTSISSFIKKVSDQFFVTTLYSPAKDICCWDCTRYKNSLNWLEMTMFCGYIEC